MIIKTNKAGKELESWPTIEDAAKAIKLAPAVLKKHLKGKPPKLNGFIFKEVNADIKFTQSTGQIERLEEGTGDRRFWKVGDTAKMPVINYVTPTPESFDGEKLPFITIDEVGLFPAPMNLPENDTLREPYQTPPIMLDEFGDPIGHESLPPELDNLLHPEEVKDLTIEGLSHHILNQFEKELLDIRTKAKLYQGEWLHDEPVDPEEVADLLRTPLQRRLHEIKNKR